MLSKLIRDQYGAIIVGNEYNIGRTLIRAAVDTGKITPEFFSVDKKWRGKALNYSIYDVKGNAAIIQHRLTTCSKYGNSPVKDYLLLQKCGAGISVTDINEFKPRIVKLAKSELELGSIIDIIKGKNKSNSKKTKTSKSLDRKVT